MPAFLGSALALVVLASLCFSPADYQSLGFSLPTQPALAAVRPIPTVIVASKPKLLPLAQRQRHWWPLVRKLSRQHEMDPALVMSVVQVESCFNPHALSPKGAVGLMQIVPITARELGLTDPSDPQANLEAGIRYLARLKKIFSGDMVMALAAYNAGPTKVQRLGSVPDHIETREFVVKVLSNTQDFRDRFMTLARR